MELKGVLKEKIFVDESERLISEGWVNAEINLLVRDKEKVLGFFDEIVEGFETDYLKPLKITLNQIEENPFLGVISINFFAFDFRTLANTVMQFAPIGIEIKKESINFSIEDLNAILLDICDIVKTYRYLVEKPVEKEISGSGEESLTENSMENLTAVMSFETSEKTPDQVENFIKKFLKELRSEKNISVLNEYVDEIIPETVEGENFFFGNFEVEIIAPVIKMFELVVKYRPTSIELTNPQKITLNKKEIYSILSKLIPVSQKYSEKIMKKEAMKKEAFS